MRESQEAIQFSIQMENDEFDRHRSFRILNMNYSYLLYLVFALEDGYCICKPLVYYRDLVMSLRFQRKKTLSSLNAQTTHLI